MYSYAEDGPLGLIPSTSASTINSSRTDDVDADLYEGTDMRLLEKEPSITQEDLKNRTAIVWR